MRTYIVTELTVDHAGVAMVCIDENGEYFLKEIPCQLANILISKGFSI